MINDKFNDIKNCIIFNEIFTRLKQYFIKYGHNKLFSDTHLVNYEPKFKNVKDFLKLKYVSYNFDYSITDHKGEHRATSNIDLLYTIKNPNDYIDVVFPTVLTPNEYCGTELKVTGFILKLRFDLYSYILNKKEKTSEKLLDNNSVELNVLVKADYQKNSMDYYLDEFKNVDGFLSEFSIFLYKNKQSNTNHNYYLDMYNKFASSIEKRDLINWNRFPPIAVRNFIISIENIIRLNSVDVFNTQKGKNRIVVQLEAYDEYMRRPINERYEIAKIIDKGSPISSFMNESVTLD